MGKLMNRHSASAKASDTRPATASTGSGAVMDVSGPPSAGEVTA
jgi:hypothetical protein